MQHCQSATLSRLEWAFWKHFSLGAQVICQKLVALSIGSTLWRLVLWNLPGSQAIRVFGAFCTRIL